MVCSASCEGSTARHAGMDLELAQVPAILMNDKCTICGGEEQVKPGHILSEIRGEGEDPFFWALPEGVQHSVEEQASLWTDLSDI